jgi:hypothetical protein
MPEEIINLISIFQLVPLGKRIFKLKKSGFKVINKDSNGEAPA